MNEDTKILRTKTGDAAVLFPDHYFDIVYVDANHKNPFRRVSPAGYQNKFDANKYVRLVNEAGRSIMLPFLKEEEKETKTASLESFFNP